MNPVYFKLNGDELLLEQMLETYEGMPLFFVCRGQENRYLVLCVDFEGEEYVLVQISTRRLEELLFGEITMREAFQKSSTYWDIVCGELPTEDQVTEKRTSDIPQDLLPYEGARFELVREDQRVYAYALKEELQRMQWGPMRQIPLSLDFDGSFYEEPIDIKAMTQQLLCRRADVNLKREENKEIAASEKLLLAA